MRSGGSCRNKRYALPPKNKERERLLRSGRVYGPCHLPTTLVIFQEGFCVVTLDNPLLIGGSGAHRATVRIVLFVIVPGPSGCAGLLLLSCELVLCRYGRHKFGFSNAWTRHDEGNRTTDRRKIWEESGTRPSQSDYATVRIGSYRNFSHQSTHCRLGGQAQTELTASASRCVGNIMFPW